jgi:allantoicase
MKGDDALAVFTGLVDLASAALGGRALEASDDFFAEKENLLQPGPAVFDPDRYTDRGKWMDGWESRRKRVPGHDWCVVALGTRGVVRGLDIDTSHFLGNHPPFASVDARDSEDAAWVEILPQSPLRPGSHNLFALAPSRAFTQLRLHIYPDGGVARFRAYGTVVPDPARLASGDEVDLASTLEGGLALACSDAFFGPMQNLLLPGRAHDMGGGWETRRKRAPGHDWIVVRLGTSGSLTRVEIDTHHFKGNFPDRAALDGIYWPDAPLWELASGRGSWSEVLPETKLRASAPHHFARELTARGPFTHLRLRIYPDGGVSRLRAHGVPEGAARPAPDALVGHLNQVPQELLVGNLLGCTGVRAWAEELASRRPFATRDALWAVAHGTWWSLGPDAWRAAFEHHPRIGGDLEAWRKKLGVSAAAVERSASEQAGVAMASEETLAALAAGNRAYEARFGHLFLVCASGQTADGMLAALRDRLAHDPDDELRIAAAEQAKITRLRMERLLP